jgi:hypothetical protein
VRGDRLARRESGSDMVSLAEPVSPELVLVAGDARAAAIAALPESPWLLVALRGYPSGTPRAPTSIATGSDDADQTRMPSADEDVDRSAPSVLKAIVSYAAWHVVLGALFGIGVLTVTVVALLALSFAR